MNPSTASPEEPRPAWRRYFVLVYGLALGLALIKFGNPVILDHKVAPPADLEQFLGFSWPASWANAIFSLLGVAALLTIRPSVVIARARIPVSLLLLPLFWFGWQILSGTHTVDELLTRVTQAQLFGCLLCYFVGALILAQENWQRLLLPGLLAAFAFTLVKGANQHHFEFRRDYETLHDGERTGWTNFPPEVIQSLTESQLILQTNGTRIANPVILEKLRRGRVNGTLVYPNAFAGAILLLLPVALALALTGTRGMRPWLRQVVIVLCAGLGLGCLYWTGSKSGWLIALGMAVLGFALRAPGSSRTKLGIAAVIAAVGLVAFGLRFQSYFAGGATSVSARFDYWRAAVQVVREHPIVGTGPGTFQRPYARLKAPESEMARLTHNDYLQQASDSGIPGFIAYTAWIIGILTVGARKLTSPVAFATYLGICGWFAQGLSEFSLYIPALAWTAFTLAGVLVGLPPENRSTAPAARP